jgi:hypothetical protein
VAIKLGDGVAHYSGVRSCGLVWACPVCGPKIRARRALELADALREAQGQGLGLVFMTLTVSHHAGDSLAGVYSRQEAAWRGLQQSRAWKRQLELLGVVGHVVFREITFGVRNGWHPHRHVVLVVRRPVGAAELETWRVGAWRAWEAQLARRGLSSSLAHGLDVRAVQDGAAGGVGWYVSKVAQEMARGDLKRARGEGQFTPEQLLDLVLEDGDAESADRWREYARATAGRRMLTWSTGLRKRLQAGEELSDEEVAAEEVAGEVVAVVDRACWREIVRQGVAVEVLEAAEASLESLAAMLGAACGSSGWALCGP